MSCAAIGGGSSFKQQGNSGYVTITGGEVYAQSIGGVAIGGGSSNSVQGGSAEFTMKDGTVVAKSLPGNIAGLSVSAGAGIGGGTGGSESGKNGGNATIDISGGTLQTGSIGGGGTNSPRICYGKYFWR